MEGGAWGGACHVVHEAGDDPGSLLQDGAALRPSAG